MKETELYRRITSDDNIFLAIYSLKSYVFEKNLLAAKHYEDLKCLDIYNASVISKLLDEVKSMLKKILIDDDFFCAHVYFRPKKLKPRDEHSDAEPKNRIVSRPIHVTDMISNIAIGAILNVILYENMEEDSKSELELTDFAKIFPSNFYGNIPSKHPKFLFENWIKKYKQYDEYSSNKFDRYFETAEYSHEVTLDLKNFFPTIDPLFVIKKIKSYFWFEDEKEMNLFERCLIKLSYLKLTNIKKGEISDLYYSSFDVKNVGDNDALFTEGVPQGLPQSYLFGNIVMMEIKDIYTNIFEKADMLFYVDDSVIFTNKYGQETDVDSIKKMFSDDLKSINNQLEKMTEKTNDSYTKYSNKLLDPYFDNVYKIEVHEEGKSYCSKIKGSSYGEGRLSSMNRERSIIAGDMKSLFMDIDEDNIENKINALRDAIDIDIKNIKEKLAKDVSSDPEKVQEWNHYLDKLVRYKKFLNLRSTMITLRKNVSSMDEETTEIDALVEVLIEKYKKFSIESMEELEEFFDDYDEVINVSVVNYVLSNLVVREYVDKITDVIEDYSKKIFDSKFKEISYDYKQLEIYKHPTRGRKKRSEWDSKIIESPSNKEFNKYGILDKISSYKLNKKNVHSKQLSIKYLKNFANTLKNEDTYKDFFDSYFPNIDGENYIRQVTKGTDAIYREILNSYISSALNIKTHDDIVFASLSSSQMSYAELIILVYLRSSYFDLNKFIEKFTEMMDAADTKIIDYSLIEVLPHFKKMVAKPDKMESLIKVHRFTSELWENGSKHLHFYTLHNQNHAIKLIKHASTIVKSLDVIQIKKIDYYILFAACYLHDISMAIIPDLHSDFSTSRDSQNIVKNFKKLIYEILKFGNDKFGLSEILETVETKNIRNVLLVMYSEMDEFFENDVRNKHVKNSSKLIRDDKFIDFLEELERDYIAELSEKHGYKTFDIYGVKSSVKANNEVISKKYLSILLRLADLMDVASDRISDMIFKKQSKHMNPISKYHWLTHKITDKIEFTVDYKVGDDPNDKTSRLFPKKITEEVTVRFYINTNFDINLKYRNEEYKYSYGLYRVDIDHELDESDKSISDDCSILGRIAINDSKNEENEVCKNSNIKWFLHKNDYLVYELYHLQRYLNSLDYNYYSTKFYIDIMLSTKPAKLDSENIDLISKTIVK